MAQAVVLGHGVHEPGDERKPGPPGQRPLVEKEEAVHAVMVPSCRRATGMPAQAKRFTQAIARSEASDGEDEVVPALDVLPLDARPQRPLASVNTEANAAVR